MYVNCANLNAVVQDNTPTVSAKMVEEKRRLDAKRFATVRKKINAISRAASLRQPNTPGYGGNMAMNSMRKTMSYEGDDSDDEDSGNLLS